MKKIFLLCLSLFLVSAAITAQQKMNRGPVSLEKIKQWEKAKLIEVLDLDEETAVKFFARRNEHELKVKESVEEKNKLVREISRQIRKGGEMSGEEAQDKLKKILDAENLIMKSRESFLSSLNDLLSPQQILRLAVFEHHFRNEIRQKLIEGRRQPEKPE